MPRIYNKLEFNERRRNLRLNVPPAETRLWGLLRRRSLHGLQFRRQHGIGAYVVDFYCPRLKLAIEVDGESHFQPKAVEYDRERNAFLQSIGIRVYRIRNDEIHDNLEGVLLRLDQLVVKLIQDHP